MNLLKRNKSGSIVLNLSVILIVLASVKSLPIGDQDIEGTPPLRDETRFPNGTVIGKYAYMDSDGNPIHVRYYADDSRYGVELNSVKIFHDLAETSPLQAKKNMKEDSTFETSPDLDSLKLPFAIKKYKTNDPFEYLNEETTTARLNHFKPDHKASPDFEVYMQKDLGATKKCDKEKVRVFNYENNKRKLRNVMNNYIPSKYCQGF